MTHSILFVDDEPMVLNGLARMLRDQKAHWDMVFVEGGRQALNALKDRPFDVIVTDMIMPGMSGDQLLHEVATLYPSTSRVILSGHCDHDTACRLVGEDHFYLSKPCSKEIFIETINKALLIRSNRDAAPS